MMIANEISGWRMVILLIAIVHGATGQMKWSSWSRYSECSVTCGQGRQRRQRSCIKTSPTSTGTCAGPKEMYAPCQMLTCPKKKVLRCNCGCTMQAKYGKIVSRLPSRETRSCEWKILVKKGERISLNVTKLTLKAGWVRIASGNTALLTLLKPGPEPKYPWRYESEGNVMTLELLSYPDSSGLSTADTFLSAEYMQLNKKKIVKKEAPRKNADTGNNPSQQTNNNKNIDTSHNSNNLKSPNVTAIIGITACVVVIVLVAVFLGVRRHRKRSESEADKQQRNEAAMSLHDDYDGAKPRSAAASTTNSKEEKPLMMIDHNSAECDRLTSPAHSSMMMMLKPGPVQHQQARGDASSQDSEKRIMNNPYPPPTTTTAHYPPATNPMAMSRYPPEYYMKAPTYVQHHDPNFVRIIPVTSTGQQGHNVMQPIVMHAPPSRSDS
eukprot:gene7438-8260_t